MPDEHRPDLDLDALRLMVFVADLGSISAAARAEGISQPSASKRIRVLEGQLRLELVERRTQGAVLTEHGRMVTDWCRAVVHAADALVTGSRALSADAGQQLRIAASQTVAEYLVPTWLFEFRRREPHASVNLRVTNSQGVIAALRARDIELGLVETPTVPAGLRSRAVARDRLVLVVAPEHPLARRRRALTAAQLAAIPLASREPGSGTREALRRVLGQDMAAPAVELGSNAAVKVLAMSGEHPAALSELAVTSELRDGRLVEIPTSGLDLRRALRAVWRPGARLRGSAAQFLAVAARGR